MNLMRIQCPTCSRQLKVPESKAHKSLVCPLCNAKFKLNEDSSTVVAKEQNELFGPPVSSEFSSRNFESDPFGNIDELIDHSASTEPENVVESTQSPPPAADTPSSAAQAWEQEKKITSKFDESLHRNGIGLLILAIGVSLVPLAATKVPSLNALLTVLPITAALLGFIACFMLAFSMRRGSIAAILMCAIPFMLICGTSAGSYFYARYMAIESIEIGQDAVVDAVDIVGGEDDELDFDINEINDNAATRFVPPKKKSAAPGKPVPQPPSGKTASTEGERNKRDSSSSSKNPSGATVAAPSEEIPPSAPPETKAEPTTDPIVVNRKNRSERSARIWLEPASEPVYERKLRSIKEMERSFFKGHVVHDEIKFPADLKTNFMLSEVIGQTTVYGVAIYDHTPIKGFNLLMNDRSELTAIVPTTTGDQPFDTLFASARNELAGLNLNYADGKFLGAQGIFRASDRSTGESTWFGQPAGRNNVKTMQTFQPIHGIVVYRQQTDVVGLRLIVKGDHQ